MRRRGLAAALAVGAVAALIASLGIRHADAGQPPNLRYYPPCAVGGFTTDVRVASSGTSVLTLEGSIAPCETLPFNPNDFAWEIRQYSDASYLVLRRPFQFWSDPTPVTGDVWLNESTRAVCLTYGGGVEHRVQCVSVAPGEDGGPSTTAPIPVTDPILDVPDLNVMPPVTQRPNPICANCP
jgi:hypothetical protein